MDSRRDRRRHREHLGRTGGLGNDRSWIDEIIDTTPSVIEYVRGVLPRGFPEAMANSIFSGMRQHAAQL